MWGPREVDTLSRFSEAGTEAVKEYEVWCPESAICLQLGGDDLALLCTPTPAPLQARACWPGSWCGAGPLAGTLGDVVLPGQAGPLGRVRRWGVLSLGLLGAPALVEHRWQVGCVHLSELLIVTQSGSQVPVFAWRREMTRDYNTDA